MADTVKTLAQLQALLADNDTGDISAQDVRDMLVSLFNWENNQADPTSISYTGDVIITGDLAVTGTVDGVDVSEHTGNRSTMHLPDPSSHTGHILKVSGDEEAQWVPGSDVLDPLEVGEIAGVNSESGLTLSGQQGDATMVVKTTEIELHELVTIDGLDPSEHMDDVYDQDPREPATKHLPPQTGKNGYYLQSDGNGANWVATTVAEHELDDHDLSGMSAGLLAISTLPDTTKYVSDTGVSIDDLVELTDFATHLQEVTDSETATFTHLPYQDADTNAKYLMSLGADGAMWVSAEAIGTVSSVFGRTGAIEAAANDYASYYAPLSHVGDGGTDAHPLATLTTAGFLSSTLWTKLQSIENFANKYVHPSTGTCPQDPKTHTHGSLTKAVTLAVDGVPKLYIKVESGIVTDMYLI